MGPISWHVIRVGISKRSARDLGLEFSDSQLSGLGRSQEDASVEVVEGGLGALWGSILFMEKRGEQ